MICYNFMRLDCFQFLLHNICFLVFTTHHVGLRKGGASPAYDSCINSRNKKSKYHDRGVDLCLGCTFCILECLYCGCIVEVIE